LFNLSHKLAGCRRWITVAEDAVLSASDALSALEASIVKAIREAARAAHAAEVLGQAIDAMTAMEGRTHART